MARSHRKMGKKRRKRRKRQKRDGRSRGGLQFLGCLALTFLFVAHVGAERIPHALQLHNWLIYFIVFLLGIVLSKNLPRAFRRFSRTSRAPKSWFQLHALSTFLAMVFLLYWSSGNVLDGGFVIHPETLALYEPFLHAGVLFAIVSFLMGLRRVYFWWTIIDLTPGRLVFLVYGVAACTGALLMILPFSLQPNAVVSLIDTLFISVSALTLTGLSPISVANTFTLFGQSVILLLIQLGGLGIIVLGVSIVALTQKRLSLSLSLLSQNELYDMPQMGELRHFIAKVIGMTLVFELIGCVLIYPMLPDTITDKLFVTIFHSISAFCNAGFSTLEGNLFQPDFSGIQAVVVFLVFCSNFGFLVMVECYDFVSQKRRRFSSDSRLSAITGLAVCFAGVVAIFLAESYNPANALPWGERLGHAIFYSVAGKTSGFNISDVASMGQGALLVLWVIMIIGGGSLSTAGGIKTSTFGVLFMAGLSLFQGHKWIQFHRTEIPWLVLQKAVAIVMLYFSVLFGAILLVGAIEHLDPFATTFEMISALSTVGLSMGITEKVGGVSKFIMILLMLAGRLGFISIVYVGIGKISAQKYRCAKDRFMVG